MLKKAIATQGRICANIGELVAQSRRTEIYANLLLVVTGKTASI